MIKSKFKLTIGVTLLGLCAFTSSSLAHGPGKIHTIHHGHKHVAVIVHKPLLPLTPVVTKTVVVTKKPIVVVKRPIVYPVRRAIRIARRY